MTGSVDVRTRSVDAVGPQDASAFWTGPWREALARHGARAGDDADGLELPRLAIAVEGDVWTLRRGRDGVEAVPGRHAELEIALDRAGFADFVCERRTALGLVIGARAEGTPAAASAFSAWDPVVRSVVDGRGVHRPGDVSLRESDGTPLDPDRHFRLGEHPEVAAHFLAEAGFLLLRGVLTDREVDAIDGDLRRAVEAAHPDDGESWWATTRAGAPYPCRILNFERKSDALRRLLADERVLAIGAVLADGHRPGDPFGEHFADVTAEGLVKRVGTTEGLACLPWHKDCDRGGHSMYCSGMTIGLCLTPVDADHGGLDVIAGSHRANIARSQVDRGIDLPAVRLRADRGDVTVHLSCTLHRSTHPTTAERRVVYTGLTLPPRPGDRRDASPRSRLEEERAAIGDPRRSRRLTEEP